VLLSPAIYFFRHISFLLYVLQKFLHPYLNYLLTRNIRNFKERKKIMKKLLLSTIVLISSLAAFSQTRIARIKTKEELLNEQYCTGLFNTPDGTYFDMLNDNSAASAGSYHNILDWLQGRVAGLQVYTSRYNELIPFIRNSRANIYVDEILMSPDYLNSLPVTDIAMIKIIKAPSAGFGGPGGVIAIYTKGTDDEDDDE
jgi:hypothetical protein